MGKPIAHEQCSVGADLWVDRSTLGRTAALVEARRGGIDDEGCPADGRLNLQLVFVKGVGRNVCDPIDHLVADPSLVHELQQRLGRRTQSSCRLARLRELQ